MYVRWQVCCRAKEADLANKLREAQVAAQAAADAAAAKEAELQLARQQFEAEKAKGQPVEKEIERYRKQVQEKVSHMDKSITIGLSSCNTVQ